MRPDGSLRDKHSRNSVVPFSPGRDALASQRGLREKVRVHII
jgi:hypothetical protein